MFSCVYRSSRVINSSRELMNNEVTLCVNCHILTDKISQFIFMRMDEQVICNIQCVKSKHNLVLSILD